MSVPNSCGAIIKQIHDELEKQANNAMRHQDITMTQLGVLLALNHTSNKQMTLKELEQSLRVAQSTAAGVVARLEKKGFIEGFGDSSDRRIKMIRITPSGEQCCQEAYKNMEIAEAGLLSGLTETEQNIFKSLLQKVRDTIK